MSFKKLFAYQKAFELSMKVFEFSKSFSKEETYSLTNQIRRSSRSVCANIAEAYRKNYIQNTLLVNYQILIKFGVKTVN